MSSDRSSGTMVRVRFTTAGATLSSGPAKVGTRDPLTRVRSMMTPELTAAMMKAEPRIMAWLRASQANVAQFTMDPVNALRSALPDLDPKLLGQIVAIRSAAQRLTPDLPNTTIDRFVAEVEPETKVAN